MVFDNTGEAARAAASLSAARRSIVQAGTRVGIMGKGGQRLVRVLGGSGHQEIDRDVFEQTGDAVTLGGIEAVARSRAHAVGDQLQQCGAALM